MMKPASSSITVSSTDVSSVDVASLSTAAEVSVPTAASHIEDAVAAGDRDCSPSLLASPPSLLQDLCVLGKLRVGLLVLVTTAAGFWLAVAAGSAPGATTALLIQSLLATALLAVGASTLNQVIERDLDQKMIRTRERPVAAGRISPILAWWCGMVSVLCGVAYFVALGRPLAAFLGALTVITYAFVYTPLKRLSHLSTIAGAVPGALPPLIGWAAASGSLSSAAWSLFGVLFFWQLPHFLAIAWLFRSDYARGGYPILSVLDRRGGIVARQMITNTIALVLVSLFPFLTRQCGSQYGIVAVLVGALALACAVDFAYRRSDAAARRVLLVSLVYLPVLLVAMMLGANRFS